MVLLFHSTCPFREEEPIDRHSVNAQLPRQQEKCQINPNNDLRAKNIFLRARTKICPSVIREISSKRPPGRISFNPPEASDHQAVHAVFPNNRSRGKEKRNMNFFSRNFVVQLCDWPRLSALSPATEPLGWHFSFDHHSTQYQPPPHTHHRQGPWRTKLTRQGVAVGRPCAIATRNSLYFRFLPAPLTPGV